jgi:hypothetical protein
VSSSFRSSQQSSDATSLPHYNSACTEAKSVHTRDESRGRRADHPTFAEFLARPDEEVIALSEQGARPGSAAARIVQPRKEKELEFPWPIKPRDKKRQTIHASWTLSRGVASDGRTNAAPHERLEKDTKFV